MVHPVSFHAKTLLIIMLMNRLVEMVLLVFGRQMSDPGPIKTWADDVREAGVGAWRRVSCQRVRLL